MSRWWRVRAWTWSTGIEKLAELAERLQAQKRDELERGRERDQGARWSRSLECGKRVSYHSGGETPVAARVLSSLLDAALKAREGRQGPRSSSSSGSRPRGTNAEAGRAGGHRGNCTIWRH